MLREAPIGDRPAFGQARNRQAGHRIFGSRIGQADGGTSVLKSAERRGQRFGAGLVGQDRVSARLCETANPGFRSMDARRNRGFGPGSRHHRNQSFGRGTAMGGRGTRVPNRRTANRQGFGPGRGARGETGSGFGRKRTPEERAPGTPGSRRPYSKPPDAGRLASQARFRQGTVGAGGNAGPHYCLCLLRSSLGRGRGTVRRSRMVEGAQRSARLDDSHQHALYIAEHLARGNSQRREAHISQARVASRVTLRTIRAIVHLTVDLDCQPCL